MNYEKKEIRLKASEAVCPLNGQEGQLLFPTVEVLSFSESGLHHIMASSHQTRKGW